MRIYLYKNTTDMRKGINGLSLMAQALSGKKFKEESMFVFRGKKGDRMKILWWDGQGFCLYYKCLDKGRFIWPRRETEESVSITKAQLSMLLEGIDWRNPCWSSPPNYAG